MGATNEQTAASSAPWRARTIPSAWLTAVFALWLGIAQLLLWRFLDVMPFWAYAIGIAALGLLGFGLLRQRPAADGGPTLATLLFCFLVALILLILGGEGRFTYANIDWQVRFAVMRDMTVNPWPFVYTARAVPDVLRAPIGMFLIPALIGKAWGGMAADLALLIQNSAALAMLLALGSTLFETRRARLIALLAVIAFSGLDALGRILFRGGLSDHLENWAFLQYSSIITQAFWVPNHAIAGWIGATGYLLWRAERMTLGSFLALLPLTALLSPLGLLGAMPFAALAGARALMRGALRLPDIALPGLASLIALPGLVYLAAAPADVGARIRPLLPVQWGLFELLEVLVYAIPLAFLWRRNRFGADTLVLLTLWLLVIPFVQIGWSTDFMMRGSITALTILAVLTADAVLQPGTMRLWLTLMLSIGSLTGLREIRRALVYPPAPQVRCSFFKAWDQSFGKFPKGSYVAPLPAMPALVRPVHPARVSAAEPARCWDGYWHHPDKPDP